jgi:hypothetical protein
LKGILFLKHRQKVIPLKIRRIIGATTGKTIEPTIFSLTIPMRKLFINSFTEHLPVPAEFY